MLSVTSLTKEKTERAKNLFKKASNPALRTSLARSSVTAELDEKLFPYLLIGLSEDLSIS